MDAPSGTGEVIRLFPTFVWKSHLPRDAHAAIRDAIMSELRAGLSEVAEGEVWQSRRGLHTLPSLAPLVGHLRAAVEQVLGFLKVGDCAFELTGCWANVAAPRAALQMHNHPNNFLSGVYYVQVQAGADTINFHDPRAQTAIVRPPVTELTAYNTDQVVVRVEAGTLLVFPAWLLHSVDANASDAPRISVSFNAMFSAFAETMGAPMWGEP